MAKERKLSVNRILFALIITILIFLTIFMISYFVSQTEYERVSKKQSEALYSILSFNVKKEITNISCENAAPDLSEELDYMGSILNLLEQEFGKQNLRVLEQKKIYSVLEMEHYLTMKEYSEKCGKNISFIFFFYSNAEPYAQAANRRGFILSSLKERYQDNVMIYSFDFDLDTDLIKTMKQVYRISQQNVVVINENQQIPQLDNISQIEKFLN